MIWYSLLLKNFLQFIVINTVKGFSVFSIFSDAEVDVFVEFSVFSYELMDVGNLIFGSSVFSKSSLYTRNFFIHILLKSSLKDFEHDLASK